MKWKYGLNLHCSDNVDYFLTVEAKDFEKASALWTQMQEEDIPPTDAFLVRLAGLLKDNNIPVPFAVPESSKPKVSSNG